MELPEKGTTDQLSVIIERKLTKMTGDAHNVQVSLDEKGGTVILRDADGVFVTAKPEMTISAATKLLQRQFPGLEGLRSNTASTNERINCNLRERSRILSLW